MKIKYANKSKRKTDSPAGRKVNPDTWKTGPCELTREKYYAWLKHRSQAWYRNEVYEICFEEWLEIWPDSLWFKRGRSADDLCLSRIDRDAPWNKDNCVVHTITQQRRISRNAAHENVSRKL